jgi:hypothetical protein
MKFIKKKISQFSNEYKNRFPHIPILLAFTLILVSLSIITLEFSITKSLNGIGLNIATEIIGILITILLVDYYIRKKQEKEWEIIHNNVKASIIGLLIGFDMFILILRKKLDETVDKSGNIYSVLFNNFDSIIDKLNDEEFATGIKQLSENFKKHIEEILSDLKLNPKPEYINEIIGIRSQLSFLSSWNQIIKSPIYNEDGVAESGRKVYLKSFKTIIYYLSQLDKRFLLDIKKNENIDNEYLVYLAFNKAMGLTKDAQEVRDMILKKYKMDEHIIKQQKQDKNVG